MQRIIEGSIVGFNFVSELSKWPLLTYLGANWSVLIVFMGLTVFSESSNSEEACG